MFYRKTKEEVLQELRTDASGLTHAEASARMQKNGRNELVAAKNDSALVIFVKQFQDLLVLILIAAAIISFISGETSSTMVILVVITLNAILGTVQTLQAQKTLDSLKQLSAPKTKVIRDGHRVEVDVRDICVGDLLVLEAGDIVAADGRIIESFGLQINESSLTGEPLGVDKTVEVIEEECVLAEQKNMVFSSGLVANGRAVAVVTATGMATEIGKIATLMNQTKERKTPLQRNLDDFSKKLSLVIILISIAVFGLNWINTKDVLDSLMFAVALAVAAIPEALSSIVTIVLALGTKKMAEQNAIIKNLNSVESLGSVSIICSDKTGTLTQNKMSVTDVIVTGRHYTAEEFTILTDNQKLIMRASFLCNDATINHGKRIGDPTELAFLDFADKKDMSHSLGRQHYSRLSELPFDSDRKLMSTLNEIEGHTLMLVKGASDELLQRCDRILCEDSICEIQESDRIQQLEAASLYSSEGKRVLGFAFKEHRNEPLKMSDESNLVFIGMIVMEDPPREESKLAIEKCGIAGIKPIMITGDHKTTAVAIARSIGLYQEGDQVVDGLELNAMSDEELIARIPHISVYARVAPEHKIRIVDMWQRLGQIVAMTGDGVNDAPALKRSDIGIAMGITGTEVSKDAASMVLTDDNFATIVNAIITGRNVYANIRNSISYLLSGNLSGILCVLFATLAALPKPFLPVHLLFINLVTDSLPAIAIGVEKPGKDLLRDKPRSIDEPILNKQTTLNIVVQGVLIGIVTMYAYFIGMRENPQLATTLAFSTLCLARLLHGFNCRGRASIFEIGFFSNIYSIYAFVLGFAFLNMILLIPALRDIFAVSAIGMSELLTIYFLALVPTIIIQTWKVIRYR